MAAQLAGVMLRRGLTERPSVTEILVALGVTALFAGVASLPAARRLGSLVLPRHRFVMLALIALLVFGQQAKMPRTLLPFSQWLMYVDAPPEGEQAYFADTIGYDEAGQAVEMNPALLYESLRHLRWSQHSQLLLKGMEDGKVAGKDLDRLLEVLAAKHNAAYPDQRVARVELRGLELPNRWQGETPEPRLVRSYP